MKNGMRLFIQTLALIAIGSLLIGCEDKNDVAAPPIRPVKTMLIEMETNNSQRVFPGRARAVQEIDLSFKIGGRLVELPINVGDLVKKGQIIARLDSREFEARLRSAKAEAARDEQNYRRARQLTQGGHISRADFELLKTKATTAKANVDLAEKTLADSVIKAPFAGRIASTSVKNHQTVTANQPIARLLDTTHIEMVVQVPESLITVIPYLADVTVQFDAFANLRIPAVIKEISNEASIGTRTFPVTLSMDQPPNAKILPGMAGSVTGTIVYSENASSSLITLPVAALFSTGLDKNTYVWIVDKKNLRVHRQRIMIGELTPTGVAIISGLKANDLVVIAGVHSLSEGDIVTLINQQDD
jgi:RND family efflux transporter MFP subunit